MKKRNSFIKTITLVVFFVSIILIYVSHLSDKNAYKKTKPDKEELEYLLNYDMLNDYPKSARDVVKLHCRYSKLIYGCNVDEDVISIVCSKMRQLYSQELLAYNPAANAVQRMKRDIDNMEKEEAVYRSFAVPEASQILYYKQYDKDMASMEVTVTMGAMENAGYYYQQYVLVKEGGYWKILAWGDSKMGINHKD